MDKPKQPHNKLHKRRRDKAVPNQYIVVLNANISSESVPSIAEELARTYHASLRHVYQGAIKGFAINMPEDAAIALCQDQRVESVEEDGIVSARACDILPPPIQSPQTPAPYQLDRIDQRNPTLNNSYTFNNKAGNVNVYVIDSGVFVEHVEFQNQQGVSRASIARKAGGVIFDAASDGAFAQGRDFNGHGTYTASLIAGNSFGVAKNAKIFSVRVLDSGAVGFFSNFMAGVDYVFRQHVKPAVVNMSLGELAMDSGVSAFETAVRNLIAVGVTCVVAAPDANADASTESPSRIAECITVGVTGRDNVTGNDKYFFGGFGAGIDIYAPGLGVCVATPGQSPTDNRRTAILSGGTSTAAPLVTGVVAMYLQQNPTASPSDVRAAIVSNATMGKIMGLPA